MPARAFVDKQSIALILPAAGSGTRFSGAGKKQFYPVDGLPLYLYTLRRLLSTGLFHHLAVVVPPDTLDQVGEDLAQELRTDPLKWHVAAGGATRQESVGAGLDTLPDSTSIVLVHDAVRPLIDPGMAVQAAALCEHYDGAIVAVPAQDTLKEIESVTGGQADRVVKKTLLRENVWQAQTPQAFRAAIFRSAYRRARETGHSGTDEASLVEAIGGRVALIRGSLSNIKVTTPEDFDYLQWKLSQH